MNKRDSLSPAEKIRYIRQTVLKDIGEAGQLKLKNAKVLCVGAGGLGSAALIYLAAAGVRHIGIVDHDVVDITNLHRQILFTDDDIGKSKVSVAKNKLQSINPDINVQTYFEKFSAANAEKILAEYDAILDCSDNFATRYTVNDVAIKLNKKNFFGSVNEFSGQLAVFSRESGCYRCVFPAPPVQELAPNCAEAGVLGVLPGIIGNYQALEFLKSTLNIGDSLAGKILNINLLENSFRHFVITKNPKCICAAPETIQLQSLPDFCDVLIKGEISAKDLSDSLLQKRNLKLIDVREPEEHAHENIGGVSVPLSALTSSNEAEIKNLIGDEEGQEIVLYCQHGSRSARAAEILHSIGYLQVLNLSGGLQAWKSYKGDS